MNSILDFYLSTVLPSAIGGVTEDTQDLKRHMVSIQHIFDELKSDVIKCVSNWHTPAGGSSPPAVSSGSMRLLKH